MKHYAPFSTLFIYSTTSFFLSSISAGSTATFFRIDWKRPLSFRIISLILLLFLLICNRWNDHFTRQSRECRRHIDISLCTNSIRVKEAILLCKLPYAFFCLQIVQLWLVHFINFIDLVDAENDRNGLAIYWNYLIYFLFPISRVLNRL